MARWRTGTPAFVLAAPFLVVSFAFLVPTWQFVRRAKTTEGVVVSWEQTTSGDDVIYYANIRIASANGRPYVFRSQYGGTKPPAVGEHVPILYDPYTYETRLSGVMSVWGATIAFGVFGLVLTAVGVFVAWGSER